MTKLFQDANLTEIEDAMQRAYAAFLIYRRTTAKQKASFIRAVADEIEALGEPLIEVAMRETHLLAARLTGSVGEPASNFATLPTWWLRVHGLKLRLTRRFLSVCHCPSLIFGTCWFLLGRWWYLGQATFRLPILRRVLTLLPHGVQGVQWW